jgi:hypothetical protein
MTSAGDLKPQTSNLKPQTWFFLSARRSMMNVTGPSFTNPTCM